MANNTGIFFNINDNDGIPLVGVSTDGRVLINHLYGNCLIGSTTPTRTSSQPLQVTGGAYVSGNLGIGTTNPTSKLHVVGDSLVSGVITATSFSGSGTILTGIVTSIVAGTNITISGSTGQVTINSSSGGAGSGSVSISTNTTNQNQYIPYVTSFGSTTGFGATTLLVYNPSSGNLGIGTTNPTTIISIAGTTGISFADSNIKIGDVNTGSSLIPTGNPNIVNVEGGYNNFFAGLGAGKSTTTGSYNNFIGWRAGYANTSGFSNNFIGALAGYRNTTGRANNFIGAQAGNNNTDGRENNFIGNEAGALNTTGFENVFIGSQSGKTNITGSYNVVIGSSQNTPITSGNNQLVIGAGNTAWIIGNSSYNIGIGTTNPTAKVHICAAKTSDPGSAPLKIEVGTTLLATPEVGAIEYDGSFFYQTPNSTSGRAYVPPFYTFRRTSSGSAIGAAIADFFTTPSSLSLEASSVYKITCFAYFTKSIAGTVTWTHTFSSAPTVFTANLTYSPVTGIANGTQTNVLSYSGGQSTASMAHDATASLTTGVNHFAKFDIITVTNAATNWRLQLTQSAGTATPLAGSFYTVEKISTSTGTFVA